MKCAAGLLQNNLCGRNYKRWQLHCDALQSKATRHRASLSGLFLARNSYFRASGQYSDIIDPDFLKCSNNLAIRRRFQVFLSPYSLQIENLSYFYFRCGKLFQRAPRWASQTRTVCRICGPIAGGNFRNPNTASTDKMPRDACVMTRLRFPRAQRPTKK